MDNNILSIELSQIKLPEAKERLMTNSRFVRYGDDNNFNLFLENLREYAPLHNAIITSKLEQAFGKGLLVQSDNLAFKLFHVHCNEDCGLDDIHYNCLQDLILYGGFYLEVIWDNDGKLAQIYHLPFAKIRAGRKDSETHRIEQYFYCDDWFRQYQLGYTPIPVVDFTNRTGRQIYVYRQYVAGREYYPVPDYTASLSYIALEKEIANYGLSEIRNGFGGSTMINFKNGIPSEEEQQKIKQRVQQQLTPKRHTVEYLREIAYLRPRTRLFQAVFRVRSVASMAIHTYFQDRGYVYVHTPLITGNDAEGAGNTFTVTTLPKGSTADASEDFFGKPTSLAVTGQLEGETFAMAFSKIYTFGPTFRAENSNTKTHAAEFWMIEPEIAFCDLDQLMDLEEDFLKAIVKTVLEKCPDELKFLDQFTGGGLLDKLNTLLTSTCARVTHEEAIAILRKAMENGTEFKFEPKFGEDTAKEHEKYLTEEYFHSPVFVYNWPKDIKYVKK